MASRRTRLRRYRTQSRTTKADLTQIRRKVNSGQIQPDRAFSSASHAPYGLTVSGPLSADTATFSSAVTVNNGLTVTTTSATLILPRMTTTQRNALTAAVGMIIYNTTDSKFQGYATGGWVNLH